MRSLINYRIEAERCAYVATGNPMHAWAAYGLARRSQSAIPEWVLEYFDKARLGLVFAIPDAIEKQGSGRELAPAIARTFGLIKDGAGTVFDYDQKWWAYGRKVQALLALKTKLKHASEEAADFFGVSPATIMRHYKVYQMAFPEGDDEFVMAESELFEGLDDDVPPSLPIGDGE